MSTILTRRLLQVAAAFATAAPAAYDEKTYVRKEVLGFDGLQPGDRWCLCAARWQEAYEAGMAPDVFLESTHQATLKIVELDNLQKHAVDVN